MDITEKLKFRRQYILTNGSVEGYGNWNKSTLQLYKENWTVLSHPDLEITQISDGDKSIILIGYIIDPQNPSYTNKDIISSFIQLKKLNEVIEATDNCNGRFILIFSDSSSIQLFNDATGFREVYYTTIKGKTWCASTPDILKEFLNLELVDSKEIIEFRNSREFIKNDNLWIGYETLVKGVKQLPPNHFLNLHSCKLFRFWPNKKIEYLKLDEAVERLSFLFKGFIEGACIRYKIHLGVTAGWDTRLILACSKDYRDKIFYYTNKTPALNGKNHDIKIPKELSRLLGFDINILDIPDNIDNTFKKIFYENNILAHDKLLNVFYYGYRNGFDDFFNITGAMGNGLARAYIRIPAGKKPDTNTVSKLVGYQNIDYAKKELFKWLNESVNICKKYGINIMDLYQMEQDNSHWGALTASEQNIVREEIRPFNSRNLINTFWSVKEKYRYQYNPVLYKKIIEKNWKQAISVPVNPSRKDIPFKLLRLIGIERYTFNLYRSIKYYLT